MLVFDTLSVVMPPPPGDTTQWMRVFPQIGTSGFVVCPHDPICQSWKTAVEMFNLKLCLDIVVKRL